MSDPTRIGDRYLVHELLGRGGMACVYRVTDTIGARKLALKQLLPATRKSQASGIQALFEHEFHTLKQLSHPRVIAVHDYGVDAAGPYYTMELLDGGDLATRAPMPWRELCGLLFDVCSSLALLHSRRLLHRDINPRNIRCTQDGKAKLIDFGAMAAMSSGGAQVVGTPAFTPPETLHRLATDARADLFSLGATFYAALTGELPYPARTFAELVAAWQVRPRPPSSRAPDVPPALDDLVLSLLRLEPALRPQSAFDVMQRLAAIAGLQEQESIAVSRAYLATPALVGRDDVLAEQRAAIEEAHQGRGGAVLVRGAAGLGRSRVLDASALAAMTQGALVLRATASGNQARFALAQALIEDALEALPAEAIPEGFPELFVAAEGGAQLIDLAESALEADTLQRAACRFLLAVSRIQPLALAIDDVDRSDPASASVLAALLDHTAHSRIFVAMTAESDARGLTLDVLSGRCQQRQLLPLDRGETQQLLGSLFGDVAHLELLAKEIYAIAAGNPRASMDLAQHLVDRGTIHYAAGSWTLPARLTSDDLPRSAEAAMIARIARWSPEARVLAEAQALAFYELFSLADYHQLLSSTPKSKVDQAVSELMAEGALVYDGARYALANRLWTSALKAGMDAAAERERHRALVGVYREEAWQMALVHHAFAAGLDEIGVDTMLARFSRNTKAGTDHKRALEQNVTKLVPSYGIAVRAAQRLGRSAREVNELRRFAVAASVAAEGHYYWDQAEAWFAQLERDSGLDLWRADAANPDAGDRLTKALAGAHARHLATPEAERVYTVEEAVRRVGEFVVCSIGTGARQLDHELLASLPSRLEPFAPLSPVLQALWANSVASREGHGQCRYEDARALWLSVLKTLESVTPAQMQYVDAVRNAVAYAVGLTEVHMGVLSASDHAERLDQDPYQRLSGLALRKIVRLQQGDWVGADRVRREAEIVALQMHSPSMFQSLLLCELNAYYHARDLTGMQRTIDNMKSMAALYPIWNLHVDEAHARFELVRGNARAARLGFEACVRRTTPDAEGRTPSMAVWIGANTGLTDALLELGELEAAQRGAAEALAICDARRVNSFAFDLTRSLALAEARQGEIAGACKRLDALLQKQLALGVSGMCLGLTYEARARVAIWAKDAQALENYATLTAREYRHGAHSPLAARYERLINEAMHSGFRTSIKLDEFVTSTVFDDGTTLLHDVHGSVLKAMAGAQRIEDRANRALRLLCAAPGASGGHLYLSSPEGFNLYASYMSSGAPEGLHVLAHEYLLKQQARTGMISEVATGDLDEEQASVTSAAVDGVTYEFMLLSCAVGGVGRVAGVAAIARGTQPVQHTQQGLLLSMLATHFVQAGDVE